jgi:hypothetical protein
MIFHTANRGRHDASCFALELLADDTSTALHRSVVRAVYRIGARDQAQATPTEWAFLHLTVAFLAQTQMSLAGRKGD